MPKSVKVVVCGDRHWKDSKTIKRRLLELPSETIVVEGGCTGADLMAREIALSIGLEVVEFPAAWAKFGNAAGPIRNLKMLGTGPILVIAFHNDIGNSKGTKHMVREARKQKIDVEVITSF